MTESSFELGPWDERGRATLTAAGPTVLAAMTATLVGVLAAMGRCVGAAEAAGNLSAPIRAEADDLPALLVRIAASLAGQVEALEASIHAASVDGIVRSETGYVAWGLAHLGSGPVASEAVVEIEPNPVVTERAGETVIRALLRRVGE